MAAKTSKSPDNRPARAKYWTRRTLERRKIKTMMKAYGLTESEAKLRWYAERGGRRVKGEYKDFSGGKANTHKKDNQTSPHGAAGR